MIIPTYVTEANWIVASLTAINTMVADKIKIEKIPTSSVEKTDVLIGFSVVELPKNSLQMLDSGKFWSIFSILKIEK